MNFEESKKLKMLKLRPGRKAAIKRVLFAQIDERIRIAELSRHKERQSFTSGIFVRKIPVAALLALFLIAIGVGTSFAAERALPGDLLYPLKVRVNEPVAGLFARSAKARAGLETQLAAERASEAEKLQSQGRLNDKIKQELKTEFESHSANAAKNVATFERSDPQAADDITTKLEKNLEHVQKILDEDSGVSNNGQPPGRIDKLESNKKVENKNSKVEKTNNSESEKENK